jgi:hypothetical protein
MSKGAEVEVYYHTDQTRNLEKMDMDFHITDCETRLITLYNIVGVAPAVENDGFVYGKIYTAAGEFSTPLKYVELQKLFA